MIKVADNGLVQNCSGLTLSRQKPPKIRLKL